MTTPHPHRVSGARRSDGLRSVTVADEVVVEISGGRATIALNRPEKLNALNVALVTALEDAAEEVAGNPDVEIVVVRGRGRSFCAGLDLDMYAAEGMSTEFYRRQEAGFRVLEYRPRADLEHIFLSVTKGDVQ